MNHTIGIFNAVKGSIFPVLQGQKKKGSNGKNQTNQAPEGGRQSAEATRDNAHHKCQFLLLIWHKLFMLPAYFSVRDGQLTLHLERVCARQKHTDRHNEQMENMSQSTICKQTLQKRIGGRRLFFIKCISLEAYSYFLRSLFLYIGKQSFL